MVLLIPKNMPTSPHVCVSMPNLIAVGHEVRVGAYMYGDPHKLDPSGSAKSDTNLMDIYDFLLVIHSDFGPILHRFRDRRRYWSKNTIFFLPHLYLTPQLRCYPRNVVVLFWAQKLQ